MSTRTPKKQPPRPPTREQATALMDAHTRAAQVVSLMLRGKLKPAEAREQYVQVAEVFRWALEATNAWRAPKAKWGKR